VPEPVPFTAASGALLRRVTILTFIPALSMIAGAVPPVTTLANFPNSMVYAVQTDAAGNIYVAGFQGNFAKAVPLVAKLSPTGQTLYSTTLAGSNFGIAWAILQPLAASAIFAVVFGLLAKVPSDGIPYPVFVYAGLVVWTLFSTGLQHASQSLVEQADIVTKVYFPRMLAPLEAACASLVDLPGSLLILAVLIALYGISPGAPVLLLPVWIVTSLLAAVGSGLWLSALNVKYRDVRYALPFLIQVWLFASPVVYSGSVFRGAWRYVFALNPMVGVIDGFRWSMLGGPVPGIKDFISLAVLLLLLVAGALYFQRTERAMADVI